MALPTVRFVQPDRARAIIVAGVGKSKKAIAAKWINYGLMGAIPMTAWGPIAASKTIIGAIGVGASIGGQVQKSLEGQLPDLTPLFATALTAPFALAPGACDTHTVFNAKQKAIGNVQSKIELR
jgi:hypothetical protein